MFFLNEDHQLFKKAVDEFVEKEAPREKVRLWHRDGAFPYQIYHKMAGLGWLGIAVPPAYGGMGLDAIFVALLNEALARYTFELSLGFSSVNWGVERLIRFGTEAQRQRFLPKVAKGEVRFSPSFTEPDAGSDLASLTTSAVARGDHFVLNGQKIFNSGADLKDNYLTVAAHTDKQAPRHKGITVFIVHNETPGVTIKRLDFPARRIVSLNEAYYDEVKVPKDMVVGEVNRGWEVVISQLETERINGAAGYIGTSQTAVEDAMNYARQRVQFGRPIAKFQVIKHMLVDMQMEVDAARLLVYRCAFLIKNSMPCAKEASMAKLYASEVFQRVTANGIQIMGGYGLVGDSDMLRYFLEARPSTIGGGTSQIQREIIAEHMGL